MLLFCFRDWSDVYEEGDDRYKERKDKMYQEDI